MEAYDIIGAISTYCEDNNMSFIFGDRFAHNYELEKKKLIRGKYVLACFPFTVSGTEKSEVNYDGILMLGLLTDEDGKKASINETYEQKYNSRLKDLLYVLGESVKTIACDNDLNLLNFSMDTEINKYDTNIDFVAAKVTYQGWI